MIQKIKKFFTPRKWTTVWSKPVKGWTAGICGDVQSNVPMICKLQLSENKYRFLLTDGYAENIVDPDYVMGYISGAREAMIANNCD